MPLTTPFLPLTVSAASLSSSNSSHTGEQPDTGPDTDEPQLRFDLEALSAVSEASATTAPTSTAPPAARTGRRLTFTRFPLLRKGSRELTRVTSGHFRGSSISAAAPPSRAESPFLLTGAPRSSRTSFARGRTEQPVSDLSGARESSVPASLRSGSGEEEPANTSEPNSLQQAATAAKMHQTSSRLLRMTDDERPYTRVSVLESPSLSSTAEQTSRQWAGQPRQAKMSGNPRDLQHFARRTSISCNCIHCNHFSLPKITWQSRQQTRVTAASPQPNIFRLAWLPTWDHDIEHATTDIHAHCAIHIDPIEPSLIVMIGF